jgi:hypothetical protein
VALSNSGPSGQKRHNYSKVEQLLERTLDYDSERLSQSFLVDMVGWQTMVVGMNSAD